MYPFICTEIVCLINWESIFETSKSTTTTATRKGKRKKKNTAAELNNNGVGKNLEWIELLCLLFDEALQILWNNRFRTKIYSSRKQMELNIIWWRIDNMTASHYESLFYFFSSSHYYTVQSKFFVLLLLLFNSSALTSDLSEITQEGKLVFFLYSLRSFFPWKCHIDCYFCWQSGQEVDRHTNSVSLNVSHFLLVSVFNECPSNSFRKQ